MQWDFLNIVLMYRSLIRVSAKRRQFLSIYSEVSWQKPRGLINDTANAVYFLSIYISLLRSLLFTFRGNCPTTSMFIRAM